ncbi:MAG: hypothetical protein PHR35_03325, partial [Kiritimatiellae bacterium]|nr:hypothetical protein [Kiritimatiellia bacterium]
EQALAKARAAWERVANDRTAAPERDDPYYRAAFGVEGPLGEPDRFGDLARRILPSELAFPTGRPRRGRSAAR